jgi:hypothetical protein
MPALRSPLTRQVMPAVNALLEEQARSRGRDGTGDGWRGGALNGMEGEVYLGCWPGDIAGHRTEGTGRVDVGRGT